MAGPDNMPDASVKKCAKQRAAVINRFIHYTWRCLGGGDLRPCTRPCTRRALLAQSPLPVLALPAYTFLMGLFVLKCPRADTAGAR